MHYKRAYTHGDPLIALPQGRVAGPLKLHNCLVGGCDEVPEGKSGKYCPSHEAEYQRTGKHPRVVWKMSDEDRFWSKVIKLGEDDCWLWTGQIRKKKNERAYGKFGYNARSVMVHRYSYELANNVKLESHTPVHHTCSETLCVNPRHLQATTNEENTAEMLQRRWYEKRITELEAQLAACTCKG